MRRTIAARRTACGLLALGLCAQALTQVLQRVEPPPTLAQELPVVPVTRPERRSWSLRVDGWTIEVDPIEIEERAAAYREVDEPPLPVRAADVLPYEPLIAKYAEEAGIDWRLVSAVIHEESGFRPDVESSAGAYGLMQVREIAAQDVGETEFRDPESNIRTGVRYLRRLDEMFNDTEGRDRLAIVLAAYNMGLAHVWDAQALATRYGYDPRVWDGSMAAILPLLEDPRFYVDLPAGFAQGRRTAAYVERVLKRFDAYRRRFAAVPPSMRAILVP